MSTHIVSPKIYLAVFLALLVFTATTVAVAFVDLGVFNNLVALGIASVKALLVILYFMHVRYSSKLTWVFVVSGFFWLGILLAFTLSDILTRNWLPVPPGWSGVGF